MPEPQSPALPDDLVASMRALRLLGDLVTAPDLRTRLTPEEQGCVLHYLATQSIATLETAVAWLQKESNRE